MFCTFSHVRVAALQACVPPNEISIMDELEYYGGNRKKVERLRRAIGLNTRRVCPEGVTASDLCCQAADELLDSNHIRRDEIDALLFLSQTPDYQMPATACVLQDRLGLSQECAALDLSQGCSGYVYGLWMAASLMASGACKKLLLLVGDAFPPRNPANRVVSPIFGDSGTATLLVHDPSAPDMSFALGTNGSGHELIAMPAGRARRPLSLDRLADAELYEDTLDAEGNPWRMLQPYMNGRKISDFSLQVVPPHIKNFMERARVSHEDITHLFLHQANGQIVECVTEMAGFSPSMIWSETFSRYGNLACASIPVAICDRLGNSRQDSGRMLLCGFGVGLSWASCLVDMAGLQVGPVSDYRGSVSPTYAADYLQHWRNIFEGKENV